MLKHVSTGQITITDQNDYIFTGTTPPSNPIVGLTLWIDTSVTPNQMKRWTGSSWSIVNEVTLAQRNLLKRSGTATTTTSYLVSAYNTVNIQPNTKYTIVVKALVAPGQVLGSYWNFDSNIAHIFNRVAGINLYFAHVTSTAAITSQMFGFFNLPNNGTATTIYFACLYEGHVNPPTDWTPSPEDFQEQFDDIASDNRLTPDEKQSALREWSAIQAEAHGIRTQADLFTVSRTVYDAVFSSLSSYITPLVSDLTTTSDIVGSTFRTRFNNYYTARTNLLLAITQKQKDDIDNMVIGGENLTEHSNFTLEAPAGSNYFARILIGSPSATPIVTPYPYLINGRTYVFSIERITMLAGSATGVSLILYDYVSLASTGNLFTTLNITGIRQEVVFTVPLTGHWSLLIYCGTIANTAGNRIVFSNLMVQEGNKATRFNPATKYITEAIKGSTDVAGGLLATNLLRMKNEAGEITSGISGLSDNIGFWAGGTYEQAILGLAKAIIRKDGSGQFAGGNILWNTAGDLTIKGIIEALSGGKIGLFDILNGNIIGKDSGAIERLRLSIEDVPTIASMGSTYAYATDVITDSGSYEAESMYHSDNGFWYTQITAGSSGKTTIVQIVLPYATFINVESPGVGMNFSDPGNVVSSSSSQSVVVKNLSGTTIASGNVNANIQINAGGTYNVHISTSTSVTLDDGTSTIVNFSIYNTYVKYIESVEKTALGKDGFYSFFSSSEYIHFKKTQGLKVKGATDIPGVLATGSIASVGNHTNRWGAKTSNNAITKGGTGIYNVPHSVGSDVFTVMITCRADNMNARVTAKTSTTFQVTIRNMSGSSTDAAFDYVIIGNN